MPTINPKHLPPDVLAKVLAHEPKSKKGKRKPVEMVSPRTEPGLCHSGSMVQIWVAIETRNELNQRAWKAKNRRAGEAWRRVREAVGPNIEFLNTVSRWYHFGKPLRVKFTRLGGRKLDRSGLAAAAKGVEDAVAYLIGADDGDVRWKPEWEQETSGPVGMRVDIEVV